MAAEADLYSALKADASVTALVSTRIYPLVVPQTATLPALSYQVISRRRVTTHDGEQALERVRMQVTIVASTYSSAINVRDAVRTALNGQPYRSSTHVFLFENEVAEFGDTTDVYAIQQDYVVWHNN